MAPTLVSQKRDPEQVACYSWVTVQTMKHLTHQFDSSVIIKTVVTSATATEYAAAFIVGPAAISIIHTLTDLGYLQNETEIFCDNL